MEERKALKVAEKPKKRPRDRVKTIVAWTVGTSVSYVVCEIIDQNVEPDNTMQKGMKVVGRFALAWMITGAIEDKVNDRIDKIADAYCEAKKELEERKKAASE